MKHFFYLLIYTISIRAYGLGLWIANFFNNKASLWVQGRKYWKPRLQGALGKNSAPICWFHCASLGEFEQGRPVLEAFKQQHPEYKILLTFFSPSGYEIRKNYAQADWVFYLPLDTFYNAQFFLDTVQPKIAIFVKYEFWYYFLRDLHIRQIPTYLISAVFRPNQVFFKWYGLLHREMLSFFQQIFVQNERSQYLLKEHLRIESMVSGDTRLDRVLEVLTTWKPVEYIEEFCQQHKILVCGSTHKEDEVILAPFLKKLVAEGWKIILAPHEIYDKRIVEMQTILKDSGNIIIYSDVPKVNFKQANILIVNRIGLLNKLYKYAAVCYVGGGFGKGLHNVLEAAVYRVPVFVGVHYWRYEEAVELEKQRIVYPIENTLDLEKQWALATAEEMPARIEENWKSYVLEKQGATNKILENIII